MLKQNEVRNRVRENISLYDMIEGIKPRSWRDVLVLRFVLLGFAAGLLLVVVVVVDALLANNAGATEARGGSTEATPVDDASAGIAGCVSAGVATVDTISTRMKIDKKKKRNKEKKKKKEKEKEKGKEKSERETCGSATSTANSDRCFWT